MAFGWQSRAGGGDTWYLDGSLKAGGEDISGPGDVIWLAVFRREVRISGPGWGPYGPTGPLWAHRPLWAHMGPHGPIWAHVGPYGSSWTGLGRFRRFRKLYVNFP